MFSFFLNAGGRPPSVSAQCRPLAAALQVSLKPSKAIWPAFEGGQSGGRGGGGEAGGGGGGGGGGRWIQVNAQLGVNRLQQPVEFRSV